MIGAQREGPAQRSHVERQVRRLPVAVAGRVEEDSLVLAIDRIHHHPARLARRARRERDPELAEVLGCLVDGDRQRPAIGAIGVDPQVQERAAGADEERIDAAPGVGERDHLDGEDVTAVAIGDRHEAPAGHARGIAGEVEELVAIAELLGDHERLGDTVFVGVAEDGDLPAQAGFDDDAVAGDEVVAQDAAGRDREPMFKLHDDSMGGEEHDMKGRHRHALTEACMSETTEGV